MDKETVNLNVRIDTNVRRKFKAYASMNDETMTDVIIKMINEYIEENEKKMG